MYNELLKDVPGLTTPQADQGNFHPYNQYTVMVENEKRDTLQRFLHEKGIATAIYYPLRLHLQECFAYQGYKNGDMPHSEKAAHQVLSLPVFPEITKEEIEYTCQQIKHFFLI